MPYIELSDLKTTKPPYKGKLPTSSSAIAQMFTPFITALLVSITLSSVYKQPKKLTISLCCLNFSQIWLVLLLICCLIFVMPITLKAFHMNLYEKNMVYKRSSWTLTENYRYIFIKTKSISRVIAKYIFNICKFCCLAPKASSRCVA